MIALDLNLTFIGGALLVVLILIFSMKITRQYERAVVFRFGKLRGERGPGLFFIVPLVDRIVKVDLRVRELDVPRQTVISSDNVSVDVDAVIYYKVTDSTRAIVEVEDYGAATALLAQTTLRDVLGQNELDTILSNRDELNAEIQAILDEMTGPWGIKVCHRHLEGRGPPREHAPGHRQTGGGRKEKSPDHPRRGRVSGIPTDERRRHPLRGEALRPEAERVSDPHRDRQGEESDRGVHRS